MKTIIIINLIFTSLLTAAQKESPEEVIKKSVVNLERITFTLKSINDQDSSKKAIKSLKEIF